MNRMIAITISPGATTAAARLICPWPCRMPPPAATSTSMNVPSSSENSLPPLQARIVELRLGSELQREQVPRARNQRPQAGDLLLHDRLVGHRHNLSGMIRGSADRRPGHLRDHRRSREGDDASARSTGSSSAGCSTARSSASPSTTGRVERLREHARDCDRRDRRARRPGHLRRASPRGCPTSAATSPIPPTFERVAEGDRRRAAPGLLPGDPAVAVRRRRRRLAEAGLTDERARRRREAVRPRPRVGARARRRAPRVHRRVPALPDRPLPRQDGPPGVPLPAVREHDARAGLEPQPRRERADHDGRELRRRGPRALLRPGRRAARRRRQPPAAAACARRDGAAGRRRRRDAQGRQVRGPPLDRRRRPGALRARPVRRLPRDRRRRARTRRTETYAALRLEVENWRWAGVPFFIRTGKRLPVTQTEVRLVFRDPPRLGFVARASPPEPDQLVVARPRDRASARPRRPARGPRRPRAITLDADLAERGRRGADAV